MTDARSLICKGCWQNLHMPVALRGVLSAPYRVVGLKPSRMNPNTCTFCELMFTKVMKATKITIDATILFADLRSYTSLSQSLSPQAMGELLDIFYDECASAIWRHDGILNKTIGDALPAGIGIGIDSGELSFGEFGRSHRDLTAIGTVVNTAARAQSAASAGQILVTGKVHQRAEADLPGSTAAPYQLKGFDQPIELYAA